MGHLPKASQGLASSGSPRAVKISCPHRTHFIDHFFQMLQVTSIEEQSLCMPARSQIAWTLVSLKQPQRKEIPYIAVQSESAGKPTCFLPAPLAPRAPAARLRHSASCTSCTSCTACASWATWTTCAICPTCATCANCSTCATQRHMRHCATSPSAPVVAVAPPAPPVAPPAPPAPSAQAAPVALHSDYILKFDPRLLAARGPRENEHHAGLKKCKCSG